MYPPFMLVSNSPFSLTAYPRKLFSVLDPTTPLFFMSSSSEFLAANGIFSFEWLNMLTKKPIHAAASIKDDFLTPDPPSSFFRNIVLTVVFVLRSNNFCRKFFNALSRTSRFSSVNWTLTKWCSMVAMATCYSASIFNAKDSGHARICCNGSE